MLLNRKCKVQKNVYRFLLFVFKRVCVCVQGLPLEPLWGIGGSGLSLCRKMEWLRDCVELIPFCFFWILYLVPTLCIQNQSTFKMILIDSHRKNRHNVINSLAKYQRGFIITVNWHDLLVFPSNLYL